jgi:hypothetical protein
MSIAKQSGGKRDDAPKSAYQKPLYVRIAKGQVRRSARGLCEPCNGCAFAKRFLIE